MKMTQDRKDYLKDYRSDNLKRIPLDVKPEMYVKIKAAADTKNMSVNGFIKWLLGQYITHENL